MMLSYMIYIFYNYDDIINDYSSNDTTSSDSSTSAYGCDYDADYHQHYHSNEYIDNNNIT